MKKAILIVGIIWLVVLIGGAIAEFIVGFADFAKLTSESTTVDPNIPLGVANISIACSFVVAAVLDLIMVLKRNSSSKVQGVVLGVLGIVFGAVPTGILNIVDSVKNR